MCRCLCAPPARRAPRGGGVGGGGGGGAPLSPAEGRARPGGGGGGGPGAGGGGGARGVTRRQLERGRADPELHRLPAGKQLEVHRGRAVGTGGADRKSTRLNSSHSSISYSVFFF